MWKRLILWKIPYRQDIVILLWVTLGKVSRRRDRRAHLLFDYFMNKQLFLEEERRHFLQSMYYSCFKRKGLLKYNVYIFKI